MYKRQRTSYGYRMVQPELKYIDFEQRQNTTPDHLTPDDIPAADTGSSGWLVYTPLIATQTQDGESAIKQGTDVNNRIGHNINIVKFQLYGTLHLTGSASTLYSIKVRCIIYIDTQYNGQAASANVPEDILNMAGVNTAFTNSPEININAFRKLEQGKRYRFLKDEIITITPQFSAGGAIFKKPIEYHHEFKKPLPIEYSSTTGALNEIRTNNILVAFMADANSSSAGKVQVQSLLCRIRYTE
jgi:hypothetical protein